MAASPGKPSKRCPKCGEPLFFFRGKFVYFEYRNGKFYKHSCTAPKDNYQVFSKDGQPHLRNYKTWFEKDGWLPIIVKYIDKDQSGTIIDGIIANPPTRICIWTFDLLDNISSLPIYIKEDKTNCDQVMVDYVESGTANRCQHLFQKGNITRLELAMRSREGHL